MSQLDLYEEAGRQLIVCNACRYCEGYCPVFPAIEIRRDFKQNDVFYLSNLCHDCRACYYACMYSPPHEFAINIPKILAEARIETYRRWSWPEFLGRAFKDSRITVYLAVAAIIVVLALSLLLISPVSLFNAHLGAGAFYEVVPYSAMVIGGLILSFYIVAVWLRGGARFWSETRSVVVRQPGGFKAPAAATGAALGLRYLNGGGPGCFYPDERPSSVRRIYHFLTFWGLFADFVSTTLAFVYQDFFHRLPPYAATSAPVIFGTLGGVGLMIGTGGLIWYKMHSDPEPASSGAPGMDYVFLIALGLTALTGMLTLVFRATAAMGSLLILHLAFIAALFLTAPYGKFVHAVYRTLAIIRYELERRSEPQ
jgi:citrate/tricarballylate utilization protein